MRTRVTETYGWAEMAEAQPEVSVGVAATETPDERKRRLTKDRVQRHRAAQKEPTSTVVGNRPGKMPGPTKANPFAFGPGEGLGDPLGVPETKRNLVHAHRALAKIMRSRVNVDELDDEFETAASAYSDIANHLLPWLRILPRVIAPLVLVGALLAIWGAMLIQTPWLQRWWERRQAERQAREEAARVDAAAAAQPPAPAPAAPSYSAPVVMPMPPSVDEPVEHPPIPVLTRGALSKR